MAGNIRPSELSGGGEIVDLGGLKFRMDVDKQGLERDIQEGDLYIAERNTGPKLLTAEKVVRPGEGPDGWGNWIQPTTIDYSYDIPECVKVVEVEEKEPARSGPP